MGSSGARKGKYYTPFYMPKHSPAALRRMRTIRRCVLAALSVVMLCAVAVFWRAGRRSEPAVVEVSAAMNVSTYPRIVNSENPLPRSYAPQNLVTLNTLPGGESVSLRADAAESFLLMTKAMNADGMAVLPLSGYVSYDEQTAVLEKHIDAFIAEGCTAKEASEKALRQYAAPGESEAQLGTQVEICTDPDAPETFAQSDQYVWVCENAHRFGFVIRRGSQPWRLRYVGTETACAVRQSGMELDEYVAAVKAENPDAVCEEN